MPIELSVNVNAVAFLRNRRGLSYPSVVEASRIALEEGAVGITVHPRPDERHITRQDVEDLAQLLSEPKFKRKEFNIEGYPDERFLKLLEEFKPDQATFVPDDPAQATSDHGWNIVQNRALLEEAVTRIKACGCRVALFIDADPLAPELAKSVGADRVELYTGPYGAAATRNEPVAEHLKALKETAERAQEIGVEVNAGHDLTVQNLPPLLKVAPQILEVSVGHGLTSDAIFYGMAETVRRFLAACGK